jgi:catechol 2,3-dioxygenase-like lactoylglutathione lyase family enzyme
MKRRALLSAGGARAKVESGFSAIGGYMGAPQPAIRFRGLDHVGMTVPNVEQAVAFYLEVFGGRVLYRMGPLDARDMPRNGERDWTADFIDVPDAKVKFVGIRIAESLVLEIYEYERPASATRTAPANADLGGHHLALRVDDVEAAAHHLRSKGCRMMQGPIVVPGGPLLGSRSWYFTDPWGNYFELMEYRSMAFMEESHD